MNNKMYNALYEYVMQRGGDVVSDTKLLMQVGEKLNESRLERIARLISCNHYVQLKVQYFQGSYSTMQKTQGKPYIFISIDPTTAYQPNNSFDALWQKVLGLVAHEAGHIAYTDFAVVKNNGENIGKTQARIPVIAKRLKDIYNQQSNEDETAVSSELLTAIEEYVYARNLPNMLNSVEDASVEFSVSGMTPKYYPNLVALRDYIFQLETDGFARMSHEEMKQRDEIECLITEIRQFGVISYRTPYQPKFLPLYFNEEEIQDMRRLAIYGRAGAVDTTERNVVSQVLLDMLKPVLNKKAKEFYDEYIEALKMSNEDLEELAEMMANSMMPMDKELSITGNLNSNLSGMNQPQKPSKYNMDLPQDLEEKMNQKRQQQQNDSQQASSQGSSQESDSSDGQQGQQNQDSGNGQTSSQHSSQEVNEQSSQEGNGTPNAENQDSQNGAGQSSNEKEGENGEGNADDASTAGETGDSQSVTEKENDGENAEGNTGVSDDSSEEKDGQNSSDSLGEMSADEMLSSDHQADEAGRAKDAVQENLRNIQKEFKSQMTKNMRDDMEGKMSGDGVAPLSERLGSPNSITEAHKDVEVSYYDSKHISHYKSYEGEYASKHADRRLQQATQFSRKLKEVLMYQAKVRRKNGLRNGQLHDAALSRIITDQRVFKKTIQGKEKKARVEVLIDLSGSMGGDKLQNAIEAAYMLAEACAKIKVPISVMGHDYSGGRVNLHHYIEFENYLKKEARKNVFYAQCGGCNHDGLAIFHSLSDLVRHRQPNEQLVQLIISDGSPNGQGCYCGEYAMNDIRMIVGTFEKQYQTHSIGIGIGSDTEHVAKIYRDYVIVPNVETLSDELLKILKSILL